MRSNALRLTTTIAMAAILAIAAFGLAGCGTPKAPTGPAGIVGKIENLQGDGNEWSMLVVGGQQAATAVSDKASCRITGDTTVVDSSGAEIGPDRLRVGDTVAVWFSGPVAESYPVQGTAAYVEVRVAAK